MTQFFDPMAMNAHSTVVLWEGTSNSASNIMSGGRVANASYVVTEDAIRFARGMLSTREEFVPLIVVRDADLEQALTQRARGVGDLHLKLDGASAAQFGQSRVSLISVKEPQAVRDLILRQANIVRAYWMNLNYQRQTELNRAGANQMHIGVPSAAPVPAPAALTAAPAASVAEDLLTQLAKLGEMKTAGLLTDDEFTAAKSKLLRA